MNKSKQTQAASSRNWNVRCHQTIAFTKTEKPSDADHRATNHSYGFHWGTI